MSCDCGTRSCAIWRCVPVPLAIQAVCRATHLPVAAYHVSGEFAMIKAAADRGWLDERDAALETLTAISRAGADLIITYFAEDVARWLAE